MLALADSFELEFRDRTGTEIVSGIDGSQADACTVETVAEVIDPFQNSVSRRSI